MISSNDKKMQLIQLMPMIRDCLDRGRNVTFRPGGVSMLPMLHPNEDEVILSPLPERLHKYDLPLYRRDSGQFILHRVVKVEPQGYTMCGDNQYVLEPGLQHSQMIALVTAFTHKGKTVSVRHPAYWLYCRIWCVSRPLRHLVWAVLSRLKRLVKP